MPLEQLNGFKRTNECQALPPELIVSSSLQEAVKDYFLETGTTQAVDAIVVRARDSKVSEEAEFVRGQWAPGSDDDPENFPCVCGMEVVFTTKSDWRLKEWKTVLRSGLRRRKSGFKRQASPSLQP